MTPRPYQSRTIDATRAQFRAGKRAVLVVAPTGSGKTCMGGMMSSGHVERGGRVVWLAHRRELIEQAVDSLRRFGLEVGARGVNASAPIQVCSIQQLIARRQAPDGTLIVADEAHHLAEGNGWTELVRAYLAGGARIVGLTATPSRADGQALHGFDALVVAAQVRELVDLGVLVPLTIKRPSREIAKNKIAQVPVDFYLEYARGRSAVVFAQHIKAAESFVDGFRGAGIEAKLITGKSRTVDRIAILDAFSSGSLKVVVNVGVLTEGWDATICDCVILARGCGSPGLLIQMVGRGSRAHPGKASCLFGDLRGVTYLHGRPDAHAEYSLEGQGIVLRGSKGGERLCPVCSEPLGAATVCPNPECGRDVSMVVPTATGDKMVDWEEQAYQAVKEQLQPNRLVLSLAGMVRKYGEGKAIHMFRRIFKRYPDSRLLIDARRFNRARDSASAPFAEE